MWRAFIVRCGSFGAIRHNQVRPPHGHAQQGRQRDAFGAPYAGVKRQVKHHQFKFIVVFLNEKE